MELKEKNSNYSKLKIALSISIIATFFILTAVFYCYNYINSPPGSLSAPTMLEVRQGDSFYAVAKELKKKNIIESIRKFYLYTKLNDGLYSIKAGEYLFEPAMKTSEVLRMLIKGSVIRYRVTIPEGYNIYQIAALFQEKGLLDGQDFMAKVFDKALMEKLGVKGVSFEGHLYPETYFFVKGMDSEAIIKTMVSRLREVIPSEFESRAKEIGLTMEEVINLASIVEKETGNPEERPVISAVFHNRLKKRMRLQTDPTVIYGMIENFDGDLRKKDLKKKTPYNTYRINGLPLGPIANPGIDAIRAALYPADVDYFYFVSKNNGSHAFARTLKEHNRYVWRYQKSLR